MLGLGQRTRVCPQCATEAERRAVWCGWCGAFLAAASVESVDVADTGPHDPSDGGAAASAEPSTRPLLRTAAAVGLLGTLVVVLLTARPAPVAESLVGRLDVGSGPSASLPPPPGLAVAWRQPAGTPTDEAWFGGGQGQVAVAGDRVAVGGLVLDRDSGEVLADLRAGPLHGSWGTGGEAAVLRDDTLEIANALTGEVLARAPLDPSLRGGDAPRLEPYAAARGAGTSLFSGWGPAPDDPDGHGHGRWALVADDGAVVASGSGSAHAWGWTRPRSTTHALITLVPEDGPDGPGSEEWSLVDLATGQEVLHVAHRGDWWQPPKVVGDHALVVRGNGDPDVDGQDPVWDVALHDLAASRVAWRVELESSEPPALHAVTSDGRAIVARRVGSSVQVDAVDGEGPHRITSLLAPGPGLWSDGPPAAELVGATTDVVVLFDDATDALVATGIDGTRRWRRSLTPLPNEAWARLDVVDGLVTLAVDAGDGTRLYLVDIEDGRLLHRVAPGQPRYRDVAAPRVAATLDGLVAVSTGVDAPWEPPPTLAGMDWLDVRDGRQQALEEVAAGWLRDVDVPDEMLDDDGGLDTSGFLRARLSGTVVGADGRVRPVVVWPADDGRFELLAGEGAPTSVDLPSAPVGTGEVEGSEVVAVAGPVLVLHMTGHEGLPVTVLVDRANGTSRSLPSVRPLAVAGDAVIGQREPGDGTTELVVHDLAEQQLRWRAPWLWGDALAADDDQVLLLQGAELTARRPGDGTVLWRSPLDTMVTETIALTARSVFLDTPYGEVLALDRADGSLRWRRHVGGLVTALAAAGDHVLVGTRDGTVVQLDADGEEVQRVPVGSAPVTGIASVGPTIVASVGLEVVGLRPDGTGLTVQDEVDLP